MHERDEWTDHRIELIISKLLLVGVSTAALVVLAGGILFLVRHGHETPHFGEFHGEPAELRGRSVRSLPRCGRWRLAPSFNSGLGLLVATPVARVVFSLFAFA
jgi:uncharacterized membrane protein